MQDVIANRYTGLFRSFGATPVRAHDPDVVVWAGVPANRPWPSTDAVGGAGWTDDAAMRACAGEAIERWQTHPLPTDRLVRGAYDAWPLGEPALDPARFVRFHAEQHALPGFPFELLARDSVVDWVACRELATGARCWAPADLVFLDLRPGAASRFGPTISTGWAAHATPASAIEAAIREVVERDALVGAWWGRYAVTELANPRLPAAITERLVRASLRWRWFRIASPYAAHVTMATVEGEDREGYVFSIGSACRAQLAASFEKAALEAVQGRHYVRHLLATTPAADPPTSFAEHAAYYSRQPARLAATCLARATQDRGHTDDEPLAAVIARLPPIAFRLATPPALVDLGYTVARVIIPELQPLHGDHRLPFLGGALWNRPLAAWAELPPHPFA